MLKENDKINYLEKKQRLFVKNNFNSLREMIFTSMYLAYAFMRENRFLIEKVHEHLQIIFPKMKIITLSLLFFLLSTISVLAQAISGFIQGPPTHISASPITSSIKIDGVINNKEWESAVKLSGVGYGKLQDQRECSVWITYDLENLYFAVKSELPLKGKLVTKASVASEVVFDDSLEFIVLPPKKRIKSPFEFGFFQLITNSEGLSYGLHLEPGWGLSTKVWQPKLIQKSSFVNNYWEYEIKIPLRDMGIEKMKLPSQWKFLFARNFKQPSTQASITPSDSFYKKSKLAVLNCVKKSLVIQTSFPEWKNRRGRKLQLSVFNPTKKERKAYISVKYSNLKKSRQKKIINLKPGETKSLFYSYNSGKDVDYELKITVKNQEQKNIFFRNFLWKPKQDRIWTNPESAIVFQDAFSINVLKADFSASGNVDLTIEGKGKPQIIKSSKKMNNSLYIPTGTILKIPRQNLAIPGTYIFKFKSEKEVIKKTQRIIFATKSIQGYIFAYELPNYIGFGFHKFPWMKDRKADVLLWKKPEKNISDWISIAFSLDHNSAVFYINGNKVARKAFHGKKEYLGDLSFGSLYCMNEFKIKDIKFFNKVLSGKEILFFNTGKMKIRGDIQYFPSLKSVSINADLNPHNLPKKARLSLVVSSPSREKIYKEQILSIKDDFMVKKDGKLSIRKKILLPQLKEGTYTCFLKISSSQKTYAKEYLALTFIVKKYEWENNKIGLNRIIIPPFTPLQVKGITVECLLRKYVLSTSGLPAKIYAKGEQILASPIKSRLIVAGKELEWQSLKIKFQEKSADRVSYLCKSKNDIVKMNILGEFDFDGFLKLDINLTQINKKKKIEQFFIDIPVKKNIAKLFHAVAQGNRKNPAGYLPKGSGIIWKSSSIPRLKVASFIPYIWVGEEEKGIAYAADWDKGWTHSNKKDAVELIRKENGNIIIRLNIINGPLVLNKDRKITIALLATPIKTMPKGWRGWSDFYGCMRLPGDKFLQNLVNNKWWGSYYGWMGKYPTDKDFTFIEKLNETRKTGIIDTEYVDNFINKIVQAPQQAVPGRKSPLNKDKIKVTLYTGFKLVRHLHNKKDTIMYYYTCCHENITKVPEYKVYKDEWKINRQGTWGHMVESYSDQSLFYAAKMIDKGMDGIYLDNTTLYCMYAWETGNGYIDRNGDIKPSFGLWRLRNYIKRLGTMFTEKGKMPFIMIHDTNALHLSALSFGTGILGMEWKYGETDFQERYSPDYIRTVTAGRQGGFFPTAIPGMNGCKPENFPWLTRTLLACLLPHEIQPSLSDKIDRNLLLKVANIIWNFGKNKPDTKFLPYWNAKGPIKPINDSLIVSAYKRKNKLLLVIGNYGGNLKTSINIDCKKLNFSKIISAKNCETNKKLSIKDNGVIISIKKHDLALVELELQK